MARGDESMKANEYTIMERAVEEGIKGGIYKYQDRISETPEYDDRDGVLNEALLTTQLMNYIMMEISDMFTFDHPEVNEPDEAWPDMDKIAQEHLHLRIMQAKDKQIQRRKKFIDSAEWEDTDFYLTYVEFLHSGYDFKTKP
jgi:hypothetical protein